MRLVTCYCFPEKCSQNIRLRNTVLPFLLYCRQQVRNLLPLARIQPHLASLCDWGQIRSQCSRIKVLPQLGANQIGEGQTMIVPDLGGGGGIFLG